MVEADSTSAHKICEHCQQRIPGKNKRVKGKRLCRLCRARAYRLAHAEKLRANAEQQRIYQKAYRAAHSEKRRTYMQGYYLANAERILAQKKVYTAANTEKRHAYRAANAEKFHAYRAVNADKHRAYQKAYRAANKEQLRARDRQWGRNNPHKIKEKNARRRARKRGAAIRNLTATQWKSIKEHYGHCCVYCGRKMQNLTQDHIIPLSKGGNHTVQNVVPACLSCNSRKQEGPPLKPVQPLLII